MANVFLDLGTHFGQGLQQFMQRFNMDESWTIHTFEANPTTHKIFLDDFHKQVPWVKSHNLAVADYNGTITINVETPPGEGDTGQGTSIVDLEHWAPWDGTLRDNFQRQEHVPCIDFGQFIRDNFTPEDNIIVKMDIEGAEYRVLDKMIEDGTLKNYISFITVEWHSRFFTNAEEMRIQENKIKYYGNVNNIVMESWQ
jgi:FkbM family methyltransferase